MMRRLQIQSISELIISVRVQQREASSLASLATRGEEEARPQ